MDNLKIGVIEDDFIIAESIIQMLMQIGYCTIPAERNYADALKMIQNESPDLLLVDIMLEGKQDGVDLAKTIREKFEIPFIFITANSDKATVDRAKEVRPYAYLVKPFNERDLYSAIEIAFSTFNHELQTGNKPQDTLKHLNDFVFIKEGHLFHKVAIKDILFIESENVYLNIHTDKRNYVVRSKMDDFIEAYTQGDFFRVHRSYAINIKHLDTINSLTVRVSGKEIPLQKPYKQELLKIIRSI